MTTHAVGAYLYLVRDVVQRLRLEDVANDISNTTGRPITRQEVWRIERGDATTWDVLAAFADAIHADIEHVKALLDDADPSTTTIGAMVQVISNRSPRSHSIPRKRSP